MRDVLVDKTLRLRKGAVKQVFNCNLDTVLRETEKKEKNEREGVSIHSSKRRR